MKERKSAMNITLPAEYKRFLEKKVKEGVYQSEDEVVLDALRSFQERDRLNSAGGNLSSQLALLGLENSDIEAQIFIVLMQSTKDMDEDLKMIMTEVKAMTAAKQKLRELISKVNKDLAANAGQRDKKPPLDFSTGLGNQQAYHKAQLPFVAPELENGIKLINTDLYPGKIEDISQLRVILDDLISKLDGMNEMSEMTSLRLQMMMDRRSKFMTILSNIMKKISITQETIVQNLK
jgi:putative addiction module CopG family antidote